MKERDDTCPLEGIIQVEDASRDGERRGANEAGALPEKLNLWRRSSARRSLSPLGLCGALNAPLPYRFAKLAESYW